MIVVMLIVAGVVGGLVLWFIRRPDRDAPLFKNAA